MDRVPLLPLRGPAPHPLPLPLSSKNTNAEIKKNKWACLLILIEIFTIFERSPTPLRRNPPPLNSQIFISGAILLKFETEHFHIFTKNNSY